MIQLSHSSFIDGDGFLGSRPRCHPGARSSTSSRASRSGGVSAMAPRASRASPRASRRFPPSRRLGSLALVAFVLVVALPRVPPALAQLSADDADPVAPGADDAAGDGGGGADGGAAGDGGGASSDGGASGGSDGPLPAGGADVVGGVGLGLSYATGTTFDDLAEDVAEKFKTIAGIADVQGGNATDADAILEYIAEGGENPYSFLYGVDENAAEVNKRLLCRRGCLDPLVDVNLVWCAGAVTYSYCNRVVADDPQMALPATPGATRSRLVDWPQRPQEPDACQLVVSAHERPVMPLALFRCGPARVSPGVCGAFVRRCAPPRSHAAGAGPRAATRAGVSLSSPR